jgi:hypothetical protein
MSEESELDRSYQVGIYAGLHQAAVLLLSEATRAFEVRQDIMADTLRELSEKLSKMAKEAHPGEPK